MSGSGFGAGGWGGVAWGGAEQLLAVDSCDLFLFDSTNMDNVLSATFTEAVPAGTQIVLDYPTPPGTSNKLGMLSGDLADPLFLTNTAYLTAQTTIDGEFTLELSLDFEELPNDFNNLSERHVMFGVADSSGPCSAIFVSKVGVAYAGAVHHVPPAPDITGTLVLDSTLQIIPSTSPVTPTGTSMTYRLAVSSTVGAVYLFATPTADLTTTGHHLIAVLPIIYNTDLTFPPATDQALISVRGTSTQPSRLALERWCLSSFFDVPNVIPIANAGQDQAVRACSIALLDGSASVDPEGAPITYQWRLIDAPTPSEFTDEGSDGVTYPIAPFTGFTNRFHSAVLSALEVSNPVQLGDVLLIDGVARLIVGKATDVNGFFVQTVATDIPDTLVTESFKLLRQHGISDSVNVTTSFFPDVPGFYKFDLVVFDGSLYSQASVVILNVLESVLPRGCTPDTGFIFDTVGDFWKLVEDSEPLGTIWSGVSQVAATELYTLWQHEYSKSLQDIQRTITRRWLHYDPILAEALPELTSVRAVWSGIQSIDLTAGGNPGVVSTSLVLTSDVFAAPLVLTWVSAQTNQAAADELQNRLLEVEPRISVTLIPDRAGLLDVIRVDAPFPIAVDASSTVPVFTAGGANGALTGSGAAGGGAKTYVVDRSLVGLGVQEDDLLMLNGIGYRIIRVVDGAVTDPDSYDQQRLTLKDTLPVPAPTTWTIASVARSELLDFWGGLVSVGDYAYFEVTDTVAGTAPDIIETTVTGASENLTGSLGVDVVPLGDALVDPNKTVYLAKCVRRTYLPVSPLLTDLPALQEHVVIEDDEATLRRNLDYYIEVFRGGACLRFITSAAADVWEGVAPPDRLWAEYSFIDNNPTIEANFGTPARFTLDDLAGLPGDIDYLSAVQGIWFAFFNGPKPDIIRTGAQIFLGLPFAEQAGTIVEIRDDFSPTNGRILVRDSANTEIVRSYPYPASLNLEVNPATGARYVEGDSVKQFAPLVEGVEIIDYVKDPEWFKGILQQGTFTEVQKYHTFSVRVDSTVFDLSALALVQDFVLQLRPTYTYPAVVVSLDIEDTDLTITDEISMRGQLFLNEDPCSMVGSTTYDDANPTGTGQYWNQFDNGEGTPGDPVYPTPDAVVGWGFDKQYVCPTDSLVANLTYTQVAPGPALFDTFLLFDDSLIQAVSFSLAGPMVVPANPATLDIPVVGSGAAVFNGDLLNVRVLFVGGDGGFPTDYEIVVQVNAVDTAVVPFTAQATSFSVNVAIAGALLAADVVSLKIRVPAASPDPGARSPLWTLLTGMVTIEDGTWNLGDVVPAGTYFISVPL